MNKPIPENTVRIVKIDKEALYEFIYENFVAIQEQMMDIDPTECLNNFAIDWETGSFIFTAHKMEDENGDIIPFPKDIDIEKVLRTIPATADSALSPNTKYKDYSIDELRSLQS